MVPRSRKFWLLVAIGTVGITASAILLGVALRKDNGSGLNDESDGDSSSSTTSNNPLQPTDAPTTSTFLPKPSVSPADLPSPAPSATPSTQAPTMLRSVAPSPPASLSKEIRLGTTRNGVEYYHCDPAFRSGVHHIVLLHGASFSKDVWMEKGILQDLCDYPDLSVSALDLATSSGHMALQETLDSLAETEPAGFDKPVVLVTPSASGWTIMDWMINGNPRQDGMGDYVQVWVPVATGSIVRATDEQVESILGGGGVSSVLAIHGNDDSAGGKYSRRLEDLVNATVVELDGHHAVYLQSPVEFALAIVNFLGLKAPAR